MATKRADKNLIMNLTPNLNAFGMPPSTYVSDDMMRNSMPVIEFWPAEPKFSTGLSLFQMNENAGKNKFLEILGKHGFTTTLPIRAGFIADNFPTDTFSNEYTETFLQKFTDVASSALGQIVQMSGQKNATNAVQEYGKAAINAGEDIGGVVGGVLGKGGEMAQGMAEGLNKFLANESGDTSGIGNMLRGSGGLINKMLAGHRVDFPQIWSNSGYTPSYSVTIRLYNPLPGNIESTKRHIVGPLACFLCLATPRTDNGHSYRWPFYHRIRVTGLYELTPAAITNITIVKGGDQQQIAYNQNLAMCDVRIDFQALHRSIVLEETPDGKFNKRPTVRRYLDELSVQNSSRFVRRDRMNENIRGLVGDGTGPPTGSAPANPREELLIEKNLAASKMQKQVAEVQPVGNRVPTPEEIKAQALKNATDPNFIPNVQGTPLINVPDVT